MRRFVVLMACVLVAGLVAWLVWGDEATGPVIPATSVEAPTPAPTTGVSDIPAVDVAPTTRESVAPPAPAPGPTEPTDAGPTECTIVVRVVDASTEHPVPGVGVVLERNTKAGDVSISFAMEGGEFVTVRPDEIARRASDALGEVRVAAPADTDLVLSVEAPYLADAIEFHSEQSGVHDFTLRVTAAARFSGSIQTEAGKPIADAHVSVHMTRRDGITLSGCAYGTTDASGRYVVTPFVMEPGAIYRVVASKVGFATAKCTPPEPIAGKVVDVEPIVLVQSGIRVFGTLVGDTFATAGQRLELHGEAFGLMSITVGDGGAFEFIVPRAGDYRLEFDGFCIGAAGVVPISVLPGTTAHDCGIVRAANPSAHYHGRVLLADDTPATTGHVRFGDFIAQIQADGSFDLVLCSPGPLPIDVWWSAGGVHSNEWIQDFVFTATTDNVLRVQPRGIVVHVVHAGKPTTLAAGSQISFDSDELGFTRMIGEFGGEDAGPWRLQGEESAPNFAKAGPATLTLRVAGKAPLARTVELGPNGLRGPEIEVTFDLAELQDG
ncbi:MAG: carboxypeptidase regulatory-like domain-containing protein [Planctomycetes bacterium]|nr:carboxypeptidase regulatory-like domain-containing protein [Planctomycetota bacterium]MCC7172219.1 carboxypeptidase regulatory-like domain-containing protein [Planctomycetota bacterium]